METSVIIATPEGAEYLRKDATGFIRAAFNRKIRSNFEYSEGYFAPVSELLTLMYPGSSRERFIARYVHFNQKEKLPYVTVTGNGAISAVINLVGEYNDGNMCTASSLRGTIHTHSVVIPPGTFGHPQITYHYNGFDCPKNREQAILWLELLKKFSAH